MSKHTPGPWEVASDGYHINADGTVGSIAVVYGPEDVKCADARLIAAAPDLLEALERLADAVHGDYGGPIDAARRNARAAIAKATDGTNKIVEVDNE